MTLKITRDNQLFGDTQGHYGIHYANPKHEFSPCGCDKTPIEIEVALIPWFDPTDRSLVAYRASNEQMDSWGFETPVFWMR